MENKINALFFAGWKYTVIATRNPDLKPVNCCTVLLKKPLPQLPSFAQVPAAECDAHGTAGGSDPETGKVEFVTRDEQLKLKATTKGTRKRKGGKKGRKNRGSRKRIACKASPKKSTKKKYQEKTHAQDQD